MQPFILLVSVTLILFAAGAVGLRWLKPWVMPLRGGLAAMFTMTGVVHFVGMRDELISMVPPFLPEPELLVTITGVLELAGAAGLLWTRMAPWAAACLTVLLLAMFPANVYAAMAGVTETASDQFLIRSVIQVVFLAATLAVVAHYARAHRSRRSPEFAGV